MEGNTLSWKTVTDDREKYKAYLCSREWALLRNAVRARCGGKCERCKLNQMECVHHLTYARKYQERIEDLAGWCNACHEFTHGKTNYDPWRDGGIVIPFCGTRVRSFYLAGKISGTTWRDEIVDGWSNPHQSKGKTPQFDAVLSRDDGWWKPTEDACEVMGRSLSFYGPWWRDTAEFYGGHGSGAAETMWPHGQDTVGGWINDGEEVYPDAHGMVPGGSIPYGNFAAGFSTESLKDVVYKNVVTAIDRSDFVFAWIDSLDCFGTIMEIGMAKCLGKPVAVAVHCDIPHHELWLVTKDTYKLTAFSAGDGWDEFWRRVEKESNGPNS